MRRGQVGSPPATSEEPDGDTDTAPAGDAEALGEHGFVALVEAASDELRTPLRNVRQGLSWLRDDFADGPSDEVLRTIDFIGTSTRQLESTVDGIVGIGRVLTRLARVGPISLEEAMAIARQRVRRALDADGSGPELDVVGDELPAALGDVEFTALAFEHLLRNSHEYRHPDRVPCVRCDARMEDGWVVIDLVDNGIGVDLAYRERIFEPMRRLHTQAQHRGAGMGLTIARAAIEAQSGSLLLRDASSRGSRFELRLPTSPSRSIPTLRAKT